MARLCDAEKSVLILVDLQARLMPAIRNGDEVLRRAEQLANAARLLAVPVIATEQNPGGLGANVASIRALADRTVVKTRFDACAGQVLGEVLPAGRTQIIVAGCEAHVCLLQTTLGLLEQGLAVRVAVDAVGSRREADRNAALKRLERAGAELVTAEMVIFEWLRGSDHPRFKEALALVR